jgi:putative endonuclease
MDLAYITGEVSRLSWPRSEHVDVPTSRSSLGTAGESIARRHLEALGMRFVESNWRCLTGEIDLVMRIQDELVFVEVKTRRGDGAGRAEESISPAKGRKLLSSGEWYVGNHPSLGDPIWRIDLVAITLSHSGAIERLVHIENAVSAG